MKLVEVISGCLELSVPQGNALFGCPAEILKHLMRKNLPMPDAIVLPDTFHRFGVSQVAVEFPLYHFLFVQQGLAQGRRMRIFGTKGQCERIARLMRVTLLGPTEEQMKRWGVSKPIRQMLIKEIAWLALKNRNGRILEPPDLFDFVHLDEVDGGWAELYPKGSDGAPAELVQIRKAGPDRFELRCGKTRRLVDCQFDRPQRAPYDIRLEPEVDPPANLAVKILGASNGFDAMNPTNGLVFWVNGVPLLWDAMPWVDEHLSAKGLSRDQIHAIILSHVHDDHCHFVDILSSGPRPRVITTVEVWHSLLIKMGAIFGVPEESVAEWMEWIPVSASRPINLYGATWKFFYGVHSIPAFGMRLSVTDHDRQEINLLYTGDTNNFDALDKMLASGAIDPARYNAMANLIRPTDRLALVDAGGPPIHGMTKDYVKFEGFPTTIVATHRPDMPEPYPANAVLAQPGSRYNLIETPKVSAHHTLAILETLKLFHVEDHAWANVILAKGRIRELPAGAVIVKEGQSGDTFYFLLAGSCQVSMDRKPVAELGRGDFFGEISILTGKGRTATVRTATPVTLFELDGDTFAQFVKENGLEAVFVKLWRDRDLISEVSIFEGLEQSALNQLALEAEEVDFSPNETILSKPNGSSHFYIISEGQVKLLAGGKPIKGPNGKPMLLSRGAYVGSGFHPLGIKDYTVVAAKATSALIIRREALRRLQREKPVIRHKLGVTLSE